MPKVNLITPEQINLIRKAFPEIPENCSWLKIDIGLDRLPLIECGFITKTQKEDK